MTDDQLLHLQGTSRQAIIARLKHIRKLESQLRTIGDQLNQIADFCPAGSGSVSESNEGKK
jgi:hypothetical protein